jgi:hypothetical protein
MKFFRLAIATLFLGTVMFVGIGTTGYAQQTETKCNCMVYQPGAPGQYGHKEPGSYPCVVTTCYTGG